MLHQDWEQQPAFLNEAQRKDPMWVLFAYGTAESLFYDRRLLFHIFYAAMGSRRFQDHPASQIKDYVFLFERMVPMLEAIHVMAHLIDKDQLVYSYKKQKPG